MAEENTDLSPTETYEVWRYHATDKAVVTLNLAPMGELLTAVFGEGYLGCDGSKYVIVYEEDGNTFALNALHALLLIYRRGWEGKLVLSELALDLIQQVVGDHGPTLLPFTSALYASRHNPARASIGRIHGKVV